MLSDQQKSDQIFGFCSALALILVLAAGVAGFFSFAAAWLLATGAGTCERICGATPLATSLEQPPPITVLAQSPANTGVDIAQTVISVTPNNLEKNLIHKPLLSLIKIDLNLRVIGYQAQQTSVGSNFNR